MSYVYWPPRLDNYAPPGMPYLAGVHGLGDYAADLAAYQRAMVDYDALKKRYDADAAAYSTTVSSINASYASSQAAYQRDKAAWATEYANFQAALAAWNSAVSQIKSSNAQRALVIAQGHGIPTPFPSWFVNQGYCLTQAQADAYSKQCITVKGLGFLGLGNSNSDCGWKKMPICAFPAKPTIRGRPIAPRAPSYPAAPKAPVVPVSPGAGPTPSDGGGWSTTKTPGPGKLSPSTVPVPDPATVPEPSADAPNASGGMMRNGLLIVAIGVGGYLVYKTLRKPKAQAA